MTIQSLAEKIAAKKAAQAQATSVASKASEPLSESTEPSISESLALVFSEAKAQAEALIFTYKDRAFAIAQRNADLAGDDQALRAFWQYVADTVESLSPAIAPVIAPAPVAQAKPKSLAEILAAKKAAAQAQKLSASSSIHIGSESKDESADQAKAFADELPVSHSKETFSLAIDLNEDQIRASDLALAGQTYCLIGAAGTGKTTTQRSVAKTLLDSGRLKETTYKVQGSGAKVQAPSIAFVAYTRRASANLARAIHKDPELAKAFEFNVMTIHALLEFQPIFFYDEEKQKESMRFEPVRNAANPLNITHLVIEEASMVGLDLWEQLYDALPEGVQIIFIGDINQLPPVFGPSVLNFALASLEVVELRKVYRQAGDSTILENAHRVLKGNDNLEWANQDFRAIEGKSHVEVGEARMSRALSAMLPMLWKQGVYDPEQDILLSPFNKNELGTDVLNKYVAQFLGEAREALVHEIIAGFNKHYLAEGDRVMVNRRDGLIVRIVRNGQYLGKTPMQASSKLNRFGMLSLGADALTEDGILEGYENFSLDALDEGERKQQASHIVTVRFLDSDEEVEVSSAGDFNGPNFQLGYALTVHKAQGCEWRKVFLVLHKCHAVMTYRELFYTAVTRARENFVLLGKTVRAARAILNPRIKGDTLQDKIAFFNANQDLTRQVCLVK